MSVDETFPCGMLIRLAVSTLIALGTAPAALGVTIGMVGDKVTGRI